MSGAVGVKLDINEIIQASSDLASQKNLNSMKNFLTKKMLSS